MASCESCGNFFRRRSDEFWKRLCVPCWKEEKSISAKSRDSEQEQIEYLQDQIQELKKRADFFQSEAFRYRAQAEDLQEFVNQFQNNLKPLISLCHPDKHSNSELATELTKWLLNTRGLNAGRTTAA